jgi:hypothetical protein
MNGNGSLTNSLICLTILIGLSSMLQAEPMPVIGSRSRLVSPGKKWVLKIMMATPGIGLSL